jgi:hypothetical protein
MRLIELKRLRRIRKKTVPGYTYCKNCGTKLEGMYCHCCGQYALDIYQPFWKYLRQYIENVYQFDSKIWQTLWLMFTRPGFLTNEFNAGKINSYVHPFRLYMCISVVFFTLFFMIASDKANQALQAVSSLNINDEIVAQLKSSATLPDTCMYVYQGPELVKAFQERGVEKAEELFKVQQLDDRFSLSYVQMPRIVADSCLHETTLRQKDLTTILNLKKVKGEYLDNLIAEEEITSESLQAARHFQVDSTGTALTPVYEWKEDHSDEAQQLRQESFLNHLLGDLSKWTPLYMMFLLPLFAWLLQGMFRKSKFPYMWHFVHAIHLNTVFLILIADFAVELSYNYVNSLIGKEIPAETVKSIVTSLEMKIVEETAEGLSLQIPPYRVDVQRPCDVVEDILRIYGYNNVEIPTTLKSSLSVKGEVDKSVKLQNLVGEQLVGCGFNEILNNSLTAAA